LRPFLFLGMIKLEVLYSAFLESTGINTDTRTLKSGQMFIALKGDRFNGNDYAKLALDSGCAFVIVDEDRKELDSYSNILLVEDSLIALQEMARHHRRSLKIPLIGLTGSNGKTTSKELLKAALSRHYNCYATKGNLNNHIGVPLSILEISHKHEIAVIEMGANHQKEIEFLCSISMPDAGFITNIGLAHLEGFGGEEGVLTGKKEIFDFLHENKRTIFENTDDKKVVQAGTDMKTITYGKSVESVYQGDLNLKAQGLEVRWWRNNAIDLKHSIQTQLTGSYNFSNVLAAVALARYYGVSPEKIKSGIEAYAPSNNRSEVRMTDKGNTIIIDCYNANPSSMEAAIENISLLKHQKKILILGDMLELGSASNEKHSEIRKKALKLPNSSVMLVGYEFGYVKKEVDLHFNETSALKQYLASNNISDALVLLKGSRKMKLEQLLELL
jgi:UDP-N-acetylmuramoyl-tripeptide--D-alanyl-D-alanine ligase